MSVQNSQLELVLEHQGHELRLLLPDVGLVTGLLPRGAALAPGMVAGALHRLGRSVDLVVPAGAGGTAAECEYVT